MPGTTPSQTVGPYFSIGLPWDDGPFVVPDQTAGAIWLRGVVFDGAGAAVPDALVETWQTDPPGIRGFGRCPTAADGSWGILTVKPGPVDGQAPHIAVSVFARGLLHRVVTRIYFPDADNAADPVLTSVAAERRPTLVAQPAADGYRFDIHLQGAHETVFFAI